MRYTKNTWISCLALACFTCLQSPVLAKTETVNAEHSFLYMGLEYFEDEVTKGEHFDDLLRKYSVDEASIKQVMNLQSEKFKPNRLFQGDQYSLVSRVVGDSIFPPEHMIYYQDEIHYHTITFAGAKSYVVSAENEVNDEQRLVSGTIEGSLWESLERANANPELASHLASIYAWSLNFFKIQKGDKFKILFTEQTVKGKSLNIKHIDGAVIEYHGKEYYALPYHDGDGKLLGFYNEKGESMKLKFLLAPVKYSRISSRYSTRRLHPVTGQVKGHFGTDFAAPYGTPIYATAEGTVIEAGYKGGNGNYVKIKHDKVYTTQYLHMSRIGSGIRRGKHVAQGEVIGYVGSTGLATGPHVCYRFWKNNKQVDPFKESDVKSVPLSEKEKQEFLGQVGTALDKLNGIDYNHPIVLHGFLL